MIVVEQIFIGKTVDDAKHQAAAVFGTSAGNITFTVIEEPKKGLFGKLKGEAKVKAEYNPSKADIAASYVRSILIKLDMNGSLKVTEEKDGAVIEIIGDSTGSIIGRRGETLDAIQYLASMACNKNDKEYYRICVDSCGYREKRKQTLEELATKIAKNVVKNGRTAALEPMNPYERRIIHSAVSGLPGVTSRSVGEEPYRKVIISPMAKPRFEKKDRPQGDKFDKDKRDFKDRRDRKRTFDGPRSLDLKTSFEKDYVKPAPKPKPEDSMTSELYGKIKID